ncbi:uncharacterized protein EDB91DRAFT_1081220 [Suillus paluster]|uniref:uncharacterized protein n=1 Tax=Suillus paluster TaxID=48578 RepID=UPI001B87B542|nr:uncharacterized protein EDB91DRAFT_1081220 [Suillus paluster]KAG1743287.1 hypothetical protein EDB91DRAFT_1081220 [Suillus paluster]
MAALDVDSDDESVDAPAHGTPNTVAAAEPASIPQLIESILGMSALSNIDESGTDIVPDTETDPVVQELQAAGRGEGRGRGRGRKKKAAAASSGITVTFTLITPHFWYYKYYDSIAIHIQPGFTYIQGPIV